MGDIEIRINGVLISLIRFSNTGITQEKITNELDNFSPENDFLYNYTVYNLEKKKIIEGYIVHNRKDGAFKLAEQIFKNLGKKK